MQVTLIISHSPFQGRDDLVFVGTTDFETRRRDVEESEVRKALTTYFKKNGYVGPNARYFVRALIVDSTIGESFRVEVGDLRSDRHVEVRRVRG